MSEPPVSVNKVMSSRGEEPLIFPDKILNSEEHQEKAILWRFSFDTISLTGELTEPPLFSVRKFASIILIVARVYTRRAKEQAELTHLLDFIYLSL